MTSLSKISLNRRTFVKGLLGSAATGMTGLGSMVMSSNLHAAGSPFSDYKAMVVVMLHGGNDAVNMLIPSDNSQPHGYNYANYAAARGELTIADTSLDLAGAISAGNNGYYVSGGEDDVSRYYKKGSYSLQSKGIDMGVNALMPELANLIMNDKCSIVSNTGTLIEPLNKAQFLNPVNSRIIPPYLMSHNNQRRVMQTGKGDDLSINGWAGRLVDQWPDANGDSPLNMNISYARENRLLRGDSSSPLILDPDNIYTRKYAGVSDNMSIYDIFRTLNSRTEGSLLEQLFRNIQSTSHDKMQAIDDIWSNAVDPFVGVADAYGGELFSKPDNATVQMNSGYDSNLISQLEAVSKMINLRGGAGFNMNRQIFYVKMSGFDTHDNQIPGHSKKLRGLSIALDKFQRAVDHLGIADKVVLTTMSDFGRSVGNNGDGSDHAWGSHHLVMGAPVASGDRLLGTLPDIALGSDDDISTKGRIIPTTSMDQLYGSVCSWFGVDDAMMTSLFPNISNFSQGGPVSNAYLNLFG